MSAKRKPIQAEPSPAVEPKSWLASFISTNSNKVLAALVSAVLGGAIGGVAFWTSPLKEKIFHAVYREKAAILLSADTLEPVEGGLFRFRIVLMPKSTIQVDKGILEIKFDKRALSLHTGEPIFETPSVASPVTVPNEKGVEFVALRPGKTVVTVNLRTGHGEYTQTSQVEVMPAESSPDATISTFTGTWSLQIGDNQGKMNLHQQDWQTIPGSYFLDNGEKGVVYAHHDGDSLWATFDRGTSSPTRWNVPITPYAANAGGFLESKGFAQLQRASPIGWAPIGEKVNFHAYVKLR